LIIGTFQLGILALEGQFLIGGRNFKNLIRIWLGELGSHLGRFFGKELGRLKRKGIPNYWAGFKGIGTFL